MIQNHSRSQTRSAFTMVELIVVLLIILILVSLIGSAVLKAMDKIPEVTTRTEISEMEVALRAFMSDYNLDVPPPSALILCENMAQYATIPSPVAAQSYTFLQKAFGKNIGSQGFIGWSGLPPNGTGVYVLEGEQCLVFYLGGIPTAPGLGGFAPQGFSTNNMNPALASGKRKGPYYNFQTSRLVSMAVINPYMSAAQISPVHPAYIDAWQAKSTLNAPNARPIAAHLSPTANGIPYAYFSSQGINNGYTISDCFSGMGATPYFISGTTQFMNPNTYQIVSAGKNGTFGGSTPPLSFSPANGASFPGSDDQSNFSSTLLGVGQN